MFSLFRLTWDSLKFYRGQNFLLAMTVALCVAVITGALLVGDAIRGSLRDISLRRLGKIESVLAAEHFFHAGLSADETCTAAISLPGTAEFQAKTGTRRANGVQVYGVDAHFGAFWEDSGILDDARKPETAEISPREVVLNEPLAARLGVKTGDSVMLRIPAVTDIPAESVMGEKADTAVALRVMVKRVIPADGAGSFSLRPGQQTPLVAYVSREWLGEMVKQDGGANLLLSRKKAAEMDVTLAPRLADVGLRYEVCGAEGEKYGNFTSDQMLIPHTLQRAVMEVQGAKKPGVKMEPVLVSLANEMCVVRTADANNVDMKHAGRAVPYSTLAATDLHGMNALAEDEIALNAWMAEELAAKTGDRVRVTYFSPDGHGGAMTEVEAEFRVAKIVPMTFPWTDENWTPKIVGITDQLKMGQWTAPFPFHPEKIRAEDDAYWEKYRAAPKGFVSLAAGRKLWGSRFGDATSVRVYVDENAPGGDTKNETPAFLADVKNWMPTAAEMGLAFTPVRENLLKASAGATPFDGLFLALSFFVILAAVMLITLLFGLFVDARRRQVGILAALGWNEKRIRTLFFREGLMVAGVGTLLGVTLGVAYAAGVIYALKTVWIGAVGTQEIGFYWTWRSLVLGAGCGVGLAVMVMWWSVRTLRARSPRELAEGAADDADAVNDAKKKSGWRRRLSRIFSRRFSMIAGFLLLAVTAVWMGDVFRQNFRRPTQDDMVLAGIFFGCGSLLLTSQLFLLDVYWRRPWRKNAVSKNDAEKDTHAASFQVKTLAARNIRRQSVRSLLIVGMLASTAFLILAIGAFRMDPAGVDANMDAFQGGVGFFTQTDIPVTYSPAVPADRESLGFSQTEETRLAGEPIFAFRMRDGDNATCANLYRPQEPVILGLPAAFCEKSGFTWANRGDTPAGESPWTLLDNELPAGKDGIRQLPVILEQNTAMYMMHFYRGPGDSLIVTSGRGEKIRLMVVAVLGNSVMQGYFMASESLLVKYFPEVEGFRMLAVLETPENKAKLPEMARILDVRLGDFGVHTETAAARASRLLTVQNTYLSAFQALTALGLILGTLGLVAVQMRNMLERRGEFAMMRAVGFSRRKLLWLCLLENLTLLAWGLVIGTLAAVCVTLLPMLQGKATFPLTLFAFFAGLSILITLGTGGLIGQRAFRRPFFRDLSRE